MPSPLIEDKFLYSWDEFERDARNLAYQIKNSASEYSHIYAINRGGLTLGVRLSHLLDLPILSEVLALSLFPTKTLVVDDISDTGKTLSYFQSYDTATIFYKESSSVKPTYWVRKATVWIEFPWEAK